MHQIPIVKSKRIFCVDDIVRIIDKPEDIPWNILQKVAVIESISDGKALLNFISLIEENICAVAFVDIKYLCHEDSEYFIRVVEKINKKIKAYREDIKLVNAEYNSKVKELSERYSIQKEDVLDIFKSLMEVGWI